MDVIKTASLTKYYGKSRGIKQINLAVPEGDFFGFIGPNGAGKSTTIRILMGLISSTEGSAEIFGKDVKRHQEEILSKVGYMPSEAVFYRNMKVKDVIRLSAQLRRINCKTEAERLCERLELDTGKKISELSFGNRKKVSIVCALQHKPQLCVFDEPTSGLDPLMQKEFYSILEERNQEGTTVFLSSHILSEVQKYCRHAAVIREGRLLVTDSITNIAHTGAKRITVRGISDMPELSGIRDVSTDRGTISFLYSGDINILLQVLSGLPLTDVSITDPDLEEIFMHYYTGTEND